MHPPDEETLERFIHETLRGLPPRPAPSSLERRVLAALEQRAALPWWRKSFLHWPMAARAAFCVFSLGALLLGLRLFSGFEVGSAMAALAGRIAWLDTLAALGSALRDFGAIIVRTIPAFWLYGGLAFIAAMYAALFGLGAVAYRALYAQR